MATKPVESEEQAREQFSQLLAASWRAYHAALLAELAEAEAERDQLRARMDSGGSITRTDPLAVELAAVKAKEKK
jgi:hypothetical protein